MMRIAVVGLGLAGACMVRALAKWADPKVKVVAYEAADAPATAASGNPLGVVHPFVSKDWNLASQFYAAGIDATWRWCKELGGLEIGWASQCGALRMPGSVPEPIGGWLQPKRLVNACLAEARERLGERLEIRFNEALDPSGLIEVRANTQAVVLCTAGAVAGPWNDGLSLNRVAGQLSWLTAERHEGPSQVICGDGYVAPVVEGRLVVGASFDRLGELESEFLEGATLAATRQAHETNRRRLESLMPDLAARMASRWSQAEGRASVRVATRDRLPHIGLLWDESVALSRSVSRHEQMPRQMGLYVLLGLGARGLSVAPMAADALARWILKDEAPQGRIWQAVDPARFVLRAHQRAET